MYTLPTVVAKESEKGARALWSGICCVCGAPTANLLSLINVYEIRKSKSKDQVISGGKPVLKLWKQKRGRSLHDLQVDFKLWFEDFSWGGSSLQLMASFILALPWRSCACP